MKTLIIALILVSCILVAGCNVDQASEDEEVSSPPAFPELEGDPESGEIPAPPSMPILE